MSSLNLLKWKDEQGESQTIRLVNEVSADWHDFGLLLGLKLKQLDAWDAQYRGDVRMCWNKVMEHWLTEGGSRDYPATWEGLYTLLKDLNFTKVAEILKRAVNE